MELWNLKNAAYLALHGEEVVHLTAEEILRDPAAAVARIAKAFGLAWRVPAFVNYERSTKEPGKDTAYYRDYYLQERWRDRLSQAAVEIINARLDHTIVERLGYHLL
ncbi:MAG: hypothetical protein D6739_04365 [Nitrospirae bacterium]|nr:MAG: hypothetical protein D6739_04365 [Nitrospirota bacterium]